MAGIRARTGTGALTITASATTTALAITAPTNQRVFISEITFSAKGVDATQTPLLIALNRYSAAPSSGTSVSPVKINSADDETIQTTSSKAYASAGTTSGIPLWQTYVSPNGGGYTWGPGNIGVIVCKGGETLGITITNSNGADITGEVGIGFEE